MAVWVSRGLCASPEEWPGLLQDLYGQLLYSVHLPSCYRRKEIPLTERTTAGQGGSPLPLNFENLIFPTPYISEVLDVITHIIAVHLAGWGRGQCEGPQGSTHRIWGHVQNPRDPLTQQVRKRALPSLSLLS